MQLTVGGWEGVRCSCSEVGALQREIPGRAKCQSCQFPDHLCRRCMAFRQRRFRLTLRGYSYDRRDSIEEQRQELQIDTVLLMNGAESPMQSPTAARRSLHLLLDPLESPHDFIDHRFQLLNLIAVKVEPKGNEPFAIG